MAELKQDPMHPLKHEQCYLCFTTLVESPPPNAPSREEVRRPHKEYMAKLESEGRLFGAGLLKNDKDNETFCDFGYGMFILRAETRAEAEAIAFQADKRSCGFKGGEEEYVGGFRRLLPGHRARTKDFVFSERFEGSGGNGSNGDGVTDGVEDLDGIAFRAVWRNVVVH